MGKQGKDSTLSLLRCIESGGGGRELCEGIGFVQSSSLGFHPEVRRIADQLLFLTLQITVVKEMPAYAGEFSASKTGVATTLDVRFCWLGASLNRSVQTPLPIQYGRPIQA